MRKSTDFLDALKELRGWNDSEIARQLGVSNQAVSFWRTGRKSMGTDAAVKVAALLDIEADYVLACVMAERSTELARPFFERMMDRAWGPKAREVRRQVARAKKAGTIAGAAAIALLSGVLAPPARAATAEAAAPSVYSGKSKRYRKKAA